MKNTNLIVGKINAGKTTGVLFNEIKKLINNNENLLILDNKQEYYKTFKRELDNDNYNILVFNLKDTSKSNSFNPLLLPYNYYKKGEKDQAIELINELALEIFKEDSSNNDPFWENSAANYFTALTLILFKESKDIKEINIGSIQAMISLSERKIEDTSIIRKYFNNLNILDSIYISGSSVVYAPADTRGSILAVMKQKLNAFCIREQLLNNLCGNDIDLNNIVSKTAIFIICSTNLNCLSNILINQLFKTNNNFTYVLDNFDDMPVLLELNNMLESKIKLFIATRNKELLEEKYGKFITSKFENIINDFENKELHQVGNYEEYPTSTQNEVKYFNIEEFIKNYISK